MKGMKRKVIQVGNSLGVSLPPAILDHLGIKRGDIVEVTLRKVSEK
jgi:antitoxin component of MazEF toxin-antitoxin module